MRFWDASAIVPLLVFENSSGLLQSHYAENPALLVWCLTPTELLSCPLSEEPRRRSRWISTGHRATAARVTAGRLGLKSRISTGSVSVPSGFSQSIPLKAADSLQLAAALIAIEDRPRGFGFLTLDGTLAEAAQKEGFRCVP